MAKKTFTPKLATAKPATTKTAEKPVNTRPTKVPKYSQGGQLGETRSDGGPKTTKSRGTGPDEVTKPE